MRMQRQKQPAAYLMCRVVAVHARISPLAYLSYAPLHIVIPAPQQREIPVRIIEGGRVVQTYAPSRQVLIADEFGSAQYVAMDSHSEEGYTQILESYLQYSKTD
jgi:hypothetical protein